MTSTLLRRIVPPLLGSVVALGVTPPANAAEELRIGFVAPTTGIFAQVGKDMVDGFQLYLDDVNSDFGGAKVKFIVEDEQAKPDTAVTRAKKLILQDKVHMLVGGLLASSGYALAPVSTADKTVYVVPVSAADDLTSAIWPNIRTWSAPAGAARNQAIRSASGPATRATRRSWRSAPTMLSAMRSSAASSAHSRPAAGRSSKRSGRRSAPRTSGPTFRPSGKTPTPSSRSWSAPCRCNSPSSSRPPATRSR